MKNKALSHDRDKPVSLAPLAPDEAMRGAMEIDRAAWERYKKELAKKKAKAKRKKKGR
jgi:hypothetical protein